MMPVMETLFEEVLTVEPAGAVAFGVIALAAPALIPGLRPELRPLLKSAAKLFVEAEFDADGGIIASLADATIDELIDTVTRSPPDQRDRRIEHSVRRFARRARARSTRMGRDDRDRQTRYGRHVRIMRDRLARERARRGGHAREALDRAAALLGDG